MLTPSSLGLPEVMWHHTGNIVVLKCIIVFNQLQMNNFQTIFQIIHEICKMLTLYSLQILPPPYFTFRNYFIKQASLHYSELQHDVQKNTPPPSTYSNARPHTPHLLILAPQIAALFYTKQITSPRRLALSIELSARISARSQNKTG